MTESHPFDARIEFYESDHRYVVDGACECTSVTTKVAECFEAFDPRAALALLKGGRRWNESHELWGLDDEAILRRWREHGDECSTLGTAMHASIEQLILGGNPADDGPSFAEAAGYRNFLSTLPPGSAPLRAEWRIFCKRARVAGTIDAVFRFSDGTLGIFDWKRTPSIAVEDNFRTGIGVMEKYPGSKGYKYFLQLNLYKAILEREYGLSVSVMAVVAFHPSMPGWFQRLDAPDLQREALAVLGVPPRRWSERLRRRLETAPRGRVVAVRDDDGTKHDEFPEDPQGSAEELARFCDDGIGGAFFCVGPFECPNGSERFLY